jgi:SAM-dependent methyltransferase
MGLYQQAEVYDRLYGWDITAERDFVLAASRRWGVPRPRRVLEPFCGTGRLLAAMPGFRVGFDASAPMLRRAAGRGLAVLRADATTCALSRSTFDLAFSLIDSFRHLPTRAEARAHLRGVARVLRPGAVYVLGFDLTGHRPADVSVDRWRVEHDGASVEGAVGGLGDRDPATRLETVRAAVEVRRDGALERRVESLWPMRVWSPVEFEELLDEDECFEPVACFRGDYRMAEPVELAELAGSSLIVLRREERA